MAAEASVQREMQDKSIKARKNELFVGEEEVQTGPRKSFREVLRETPAAPLSKNVKLMLWGSAAPVVLVFFAALLSPKSRAKPPKYLLPAPSLVKLTADKTAVSNLSNDKPPGANKAKENGSKAEAGAKPEQEKPKAKKPKKPKAKPKDEAAVAKAGEGEKGKTSEKDKAKPKDEAAVAKAGEGEEGGKVEKGEASDKGKGTSKDGEPRKSNAATTTPEAKGKTATTPTPATPEKPRRAPLFKKRKPPVYTYPKREGEKKEEPKATPDAGSSSH